MHSAVRRDIDDLDIRITRDRGRETQRFMLDLSNYKTPAPSSVEFTVKQNGNRGLSPIETRVGSVYPLLLLDDKLSVRATVQESPHVQAKE